jgi:hypothetical protein
LGTAPVGGPPGHLHRSHPFRWMVRAGFAARGITYGVVGALALVMAVGAGTAGTAPDQQGALALIARAPAGRAALAVICAGLLGYALWKLVQGFSGHGPEGGGDPELKDRVANVAGGVAYLVFFSVAVRTLTGSSGGGSSQPRHAAAGVLGWPGGPVIVGVAGLVMLAISLHQLRDAVHGGFMRDSKTEQMNPSEHRVFFALGRIGLSARSLVFAVVGYFLLRTAIEFRPSQAVGVNGALARLQNQPLGPWLLGLVASGLMIFAAYSLLEARYRRL